MAERCNPRKVNKAYRLARSWRKAAEALNELYNVSLSHTTWHDYAIGRNDIADPETRAKLGLGQRRCPSCGYKHTVRKQAKQKRIRAYGYPTEKAKAFFEVLEMHEAIR